MTGEPSVNSIENLYEEDEEGERGGGGVAPRSRARSLCYDSIERRGSEKGDYLQSNSLEKGIKTRIPPFQLGRACDISVLLQTFVRQKLYIE